MAWAGVYVSAVPRRSKICSVERNEVVAEEGVYRWRWWSRCELLKRRSSTGRKGLPHLVMFTPWKLLGHACLGTRVTVLITTPSIQRKLSCLCVYRNKSNANDR